MDPVRFVAGLVWVALIGSWLAHQIWTKKAHERLAEGHCTRCGNVIGEPANETGMCGQCRGTTFRSYRAGFLFFGSLAVLFVLAAPFIVVAEYRRFGASNAFEALALLIGVGGLTGAAAFGLRCFGSRIKP